MDSVFTKYRISSDNFFMIIICSYVNQYNDIKLNIASCHIYNIYHIIQLNTVINNNEI